MVVGAQIAIIIPVWNRSEWIARAIKSVQSGPHQPVQIVVVDNGSDDPETLSAIIAGYDDPNISLVRLPANLGPGGGRNVGAAHCTAPLVGFLDSDDEFEPDWLVAMTGPFEDPNVGVVTCGLRKVDSAGRVVLERMPQPVGLADTPQVALFQAGTMLIRRSIFAGVGGYDDRFWLSENTELGLRLVEELRRTGGRCEAVNRPLLRWHDSGGPRRYNSIRLEAAELFLDKHEVLLRSDSAMRSDLHSVAGVESIRRGDVARGRKHLLAALWSRPRLVAVWRWAFSLVPPLARRRWRP